MPTDSQITLEAVQTSRFERGYLKPTIGIKISGAAENIEKVRQSISSFIKEKAAAGFYFSWPTVKSEQPILELEADPKLIDDLVSLIYKSDINISPSQGDFKEPIRQSITQALKNRVWFEPEVCAEEGFKGIYTGMNIHFSADNHTQITTEKILEAAKSTLSDQTTVVKQQPHNFIHDFVLNIPFGVDLPLDEVAEKVGKLFDKLGKDDAFQNFGLNIHLATAATRQIISEAEHAAETAKRTRTVIKAT